MDTIPLHEVALNLRLGRFLIAADAPEVVWEEDRTLALYDTLLSGHTAGLLWFWGSPAAQSEALVLDGANRLCAIALLFDPEGKGLDGWHDNPQPTVQFNVNSGQWRRAPRSAKDVHTTLVLATDGPKVKPTGWVEVAPLLNEPPESVTLLKRTWANSLGGSEIEREKHWDVLSNLWQIRNVRQHVTGFRGYPREGASLRARLHAERG